MDIEGNSDEDPRSQPAGPDRYAFTPPDAAGGIEFKRVRRSSSGATRKAAASTNRRAVRRWVLLASAGLVVVLLAGAAWIAVDGVGARGHLTTAAGLFGELRQQIRQGDVTAAQGTLTALQSETASAHDATDGLGWTMGSHLPIIGADLAAVRTVAEVLDELAVDGLPTLLDVAGGLEPTALAPRNGRVDLTSLTAAAPKIATGLAAIRRARAEVATIRTDGLVEQVSDAVGQLSGGLAEADRLVTVADRAAHLLPAMLGAHGPRDYLVLFQNNAEVRATGGMPGAYLVVHADDGQITIKDQGTAASDLGSFDPPVRNLGPEAVALYTDRPAVFPADVNLSPDFPTAAALARDMYGKRSGLAVNGVLATDPIALSYLLRVTGAVQLSKGDGSLSADNAVRTLLSEAYAKYPNPSDQDAYFARAARATFNALLTHPGNPKGLLTELARAAGERRMLVWSADAAEEEQLTGTVLGGRLPTDNAGSPTVGVFLNDGSGGKLSYYLTEAAQLNAGGCTEDKARELHLKLTLGSVAPSTGLPAYVTGLALSGHPYTSRTNVMLFSPTGGGLVSVAENGKEIEFGSGIERDRMVGAVTVDLPPGSKRTLDVTFQTAEGASGTIRPRLWTTPAVHAWETTLTPAGECA